MIPANPKLMDLAYQWLLLNQECEALEDGVLTPELEARLAALVDATDMKVDATCAALKLLEKEAELQREEAARLEKRARATENRIAAIKYRLQAVVSAHGGTVKTTYNTVRVQRGQPAVKLLPGAKVEDLPRECQRTTVSLDASAAREFCQREPSVALAHGLTLVSGEFLTRR